MLRYFFANEQKETSLERYLNPLHTDYSGSLLQSIFAAERFEEGLTLEERDACARILIEEGLKVTQDDLNLIPYYPDHSKNTVLKKLLQAKIDSSSPVMQKKKL